MPTVRAYGVEEKNLSNCRAHLFRGRVPWRFITSRPYFPYRHMPLSVLTRPGSVKRAPELRGLRLVGQSPSWLRAMQAKPALIDIPEADPKAAMTRPAAVPLAHCGVE